MSLIDILQGMQSKSITRAGTEIFEEACMIESDINFECTSSLSRSPMIWKYQVIALQVIVRQELKFLRRLV